ncbi:MAG: hypothetical protein ACM3SY_06605 [Candidatus Omnitrophota bacterium]
MGETIVAAGVGGVPPGFRMGCASEKRFTMVQWMIGVILGIPAILYAINQILQFIK